MTGFQEAVVAVLVLALGIAALAVNSALHLNSPGLELVGGVACVGALLGLVF